MAQLLKCVTTGEYSNGLNAMHNAISAVVSDIPKPEIDCDGYVSAICVAGKTYKLRCEVVEVYPITCPKCGASFKLHYGSGQCDHCGTYYTTQFKLQEI